VSGSTLDKVMLAAGGASTSRPAGAPRLKFGANVGPRFHLAADAAAAGAGAAAAVGGAGAALNPNQAGRSPGVPAGSSHRDVGSPAGQGRPQLSVPQQQQQQQERSRTTASPSRSPPPPPPPPQERQAGGVGKLVPLPKGVMQPAPGQVAPVGSAGEAAVAGPSGLGKRPRAAVDPPHMHMQQPHVKKAQHCASGGD
jgi:hypothetical protein